MLGVIAYLVDRFAVSLPQTVVVGGWAVLVLLVLPRHRHPLRCASTLPSSRALSPRRYLYPDRHVGPVRRVRTSTPRRSSRASCGLVECHGSLPVNRGADIATRGLRRERATGLREQLRDLANESEASDAV